MLHSIKLRQRSTRKMCTTAKALKNRLRRWQGIMFPPHLRTPKKPKHVDIFKLTQGQFQGQSTEQLFIQGLGMVSLHCCQVARRSKQSNTKPTRMAKAAKGVMMDMTTKQAVNKNCEGKTKSNINLTKCPSNMVRDGSKV